MLLSVVIPVFNRQLELERALRSAVSNVEALENPASGEIIIIDDGSQPAITLPSLYTHHAVTIRLIRLDDNVGAGKARDHGIATARGEYVAFLDSDDAWLPGRLNRAMAYVLTASKLTANPLLAFASGFVKVAATGHIYPARMPRASSDVNWFASGCWFSPGSTAIMRRKDALAIGDHDPACTRLEDFDWFLRYALLGGELKVIPAVDTLLQLNRSVKARNVEDSVAHLLAKWVTPARDANLAKHVMAYLQLELAASRIRHGDYVSGTGCLAHSFRLKPRLRLSLQDCWETPEISADIRLAAKEFIASTVDVRSPAVAVVSPD